MSRDANFPREEQRPQRRRLRRRTRPCVWSKVLRLVATMVVVATLRTAVSFSVNRWSMASSSSFIGTTRFRMVRTSSRRRTYSGASSLCMMPEGPEVRTLVDQLRGGIGKRLVDIRFLSGRYLQQRPVGFSEFAKTMTPLQQPISNSNDDDDDHETTIDTILDWNCKGKFIYILLDDGAKQIVDRDDDEDDDFQRSIWITLGMTGRFLNEAKHLEDPSYGRWVLELVDTNNDDKPRKIYYHDKRNFGTVKFSLSRTELEKKLSSLGPDVLSIARFKALDDDTVKDPSTVTIDDELAAQQADARATQEFLALLEKQRNPRLNVCKFLMDQKKISGVGNYILSEALHRAKIDPFCGIDELSTSQKIRLFRECQAVAYESYKSQAASTSNSVSSGYTSVRLLEAFEFKLQVYGQIRCPKGNPVIRETQGPHGRAIWYTNQQLFVGRQIREQREQQQLQQQQNTVHPALQNVPPKSEDDGDDRWTITRRDGNEMGDTTTANQAQTTIPQPTTIANKEDWNLLDALTDSGWKDAIEPYAASSQSFSNLQDFLEEEYATYGTDQIYPPQAMIFSALNLCPLDKVKVVILGQDPYHGPGQSTGLAFSVSKNIAKIPPSLRNIFKELDDDIGGGIHEHGDLEGWASQGVLLLNTVLTVRRGQANSHQNKGWEDFTDELICVLRDRASSEGGIVFLLWGGPASKKAQRIVDSDAEHVVIKTSHPSPLGATKTASPFLTSRCFSRVNEALIDMGKTPIDWYNR